MTSEVFCMMGVALECTSWARALNSFMVFIAARLAAIVTIAWKTIATAMAIQQYINQCSSREDIAASGVCHATIDKLYKAVIKIPHSQSNATIPQSSKMPHAQKGPAQT